MTSSPPWLARGRRFATDLAVDALGCLRFYSRLRVPALPFEAPGAPMPDFTRAVRMLPIAGACIGFFGAVAVIAADLIGLPPYVCGVIAVAVLVRTTGALHEDGLADTADGFGGGRDAEAKLAIMRDSRLGSYGALAIGLSLIARIAAVAALIERGSGWSAAGALIAAAAASRTAALIPLELQQPARADGAGHAAGRPTAGAMQTAAVLVAALTMIFCVPAYGILGPLAACVLAVVAGAYVAHLTGRQIGGYTGDSLGAAQQLAEIGFLAGLLIGGPVV